MEPIDPSQFREAATEADAPSAAPTSGQPAVPGYELHERIGEGAMGAVWRATQLSTRREVALKFLPESWLASASMRRRFEREIEIAARLEHPHIARVYDSGLRTGGYYYAMEYVVGVPLDRYIESHQPSLTQRLRLFQTVCDAVHHAHINGIIHRDLKPSNLLVTVEGKPFVLDFGLAKPVAEVSDMTVEGAIAGTPQYMSPEQARGESAHLDTRTDVYSLGVLLYQMLTGHLPHPPGGGLVRLLRAIAETDAPRPTRHVPHMDRDLEAVLLKALARDRNGRYSTAAEFAADLDRYLRRRPVRAQTMTAAYVTRLWLRRNRAAVTVAAVVATLLGAGSAFSVLRIRRERDLARENFQMARGAVQEFFVRLGDRALDQQPGMTRLRRMLLQNARDFYEDLLRRAPDDVEIKAELSRLLTVLSEQDLALEDLPAARANLERAMRLQEEVLAVNPKDDWTAMMLALGHDQWARMAMDGGDFAEARRHLDDALAMKERLCREYPENAQYPSMLAFGYRLAARLARRSNHPDEAHAWEQRAFEVNERLLREQPNDPQALMMLARQWSDYAKTLRESQGDVTAAIELQQKANAVNERLAAEKPNDRAGQLALAYSYSELAKSFASQGDLPLAIETELASCNLKRRLVQEAPGDPKAVRSLIYSLHQLIQFYDRAGAAASARPYLDESVKHLAALRSMSFDPARTDRTAAFSCSMRALLAFREGRLDESAAAYAEGQRMVTDRFGAVPTDADVRTLLVCLGLFRMDTLLAARLEADFDAQSAQVDTLLHAWTEPTPQVRYFRARLTGLQAGMEEQRGHAPEAEQLADRARREIQALISESVVLPDDPNQAEALRALGITPTKAPPAAIPMDPAAGAAAEPEQELLAGGATAYEVQPSIVVSAHDAAALSGVVGREAAVTGVVASCGWNQRQTHFFIDFAERGSGFYGLIYQSHFASFASVLGAEPEKSLPGRPLRLQGQVAEHRGRPQIVLTWQEQVQILGDAQPFPEAAADPADAPVIRWQEAASHVGKVCTVTGRVVRTEATDQMCFLDLTDDENSAGTFHLPVMGSLSAAWPEPPATHFLNREVRVTGKVVLYRGTPQITIERPEQIVIAAP